MVDPLGMFLSNQSMRQVAKMCEITPKTLKRIWIEVYGESQVYSRSVRIRQFVGKERHSSWRDGKIDINFIIAQFDKPISMEHIIDTTGISYYTIRKIWVEAFGKAKVIERAKEQTLLVGQRRRTTIPKSTILKVEMLIKDGISSSHIANKLGISLSSVHNIVKRNPILSNIIKISADEQRRIGRIKRWERDRISEYIRLKVVSLSDNGMIVKDISRKIGVHPSSVTEILISKIGKTEYDKRMEKSKIIRQRRSMEALLRAGKVGSKPENEFYRLLKLCLNTEIKHHDLDILPPFEIDITLPQLKIAILWDGIGHIKPIFGEKVFRQVKSRDIWKRKKLTTMDWFVFEVIDNNKFRASFLEFQAKRLFKLLEELGHADIIKQF